MVNHDVWQASRKKLLPSMDRHWKLGRTKRQTLIVTGKPHPPDWDHGDMAHPSERRVCSAVLTIPTAFVFFPTFARILAKIFSSHFAVSRRDWSSRICLGPDPLRSAGCVTWSHARSAAVSGLGAHHRMARAASYRQNVSGLHINDKTI